MKKLLSCITILAILFSASAQNIQNNPTSNHGNKFEQLGTLLPTPNEYRTASGAPGPKYWQQRADYDIKCELDETNTKLTGSEVVTYYNNSPDKLTYLWFQLDENEHSTINNANYQDASSIRNNVIDLKTLEKMEAQKTDNGLGHKITRLTDGSGKALQYVINKTMMRVELPTALKPGEKIVLNIDWNYKISDRMSEGGRGGYEYFPEDGNYIFTIAQWYPRLCVYSDFQGWQNQQFTGRGEFALTFGNFKVQMTVPADHVVGATGECQNYQQVLMPHILPAGKKRNSQKNRLKLLRLLKQNRLKQKKAAQKRPGSLKQIWYAILPGLLPANLSGMQCPLMWKEKR